MKRYKNTKNLLGVLIAGATLTSPALQAEQWVPIASGSNLFFVPQILFEANETGPGQFQLSWMEQDNATSYKLERLSLDSSVEQTSTTIPTVWKFAAEVTTTSMTPSYDLTSFDLGGHQTYRLSSCVSGTCTELDTVSYFVQTDTVTNAIPQNFSLTAEDVLETSSGFAANNNGDSKFSSAVPHILTGSVSNPTGNPYAEGYGYSMRTGHADPSTLKTNNAKVAMKKSRAINGVDPEDTVRVVAKNVFLRWDPVDDATHYIIVRTAYKLGTDNKGYIKWYSDGKNAVTQNYTYELTGGEWSFAVHACFGDENDVMLHDMRCGAASLVLTESVTVNPLLERQPQDVTLSIAGVPLSAGGVVQPTDTFDVTWRTPTQTTTNEVSLDNYEIFGELKGQIGGIPHGGTIPLKVTRDVQALGLQPGRHYCYKVVPKYELRAKPDTFIIGEPGYPSPDECIVVGNTPVLPAPSNLSVLQQQLPTAAYQSIGYHFTWDEVQGADYYQLDRELTFGQGDWSPVYVGSERRASQYPTANLNEAFRVSACSNEGYCGDYRRLYFQAKGRVYSGNDMAQIYHAPQCLKVPTRVEAGESIAVTWCASQTASVTGYDVLDQNGGLIENRAPQSLGQTAQGLLLYTRAAQAAGTEQCFKIAADFNGTKYTRDQVACTRVSMAVPHSLELNLDTSVPGKYTLTWSAQTHVGNYLVQEAFCNNSCDDLSESDWQPLNRDITTATTEFTGKTNGTYAYRVAACDDVGVCSAYSSPNSIKMNRRTRVFIHSDLLGTPVVETNDAGEKL